MLTASRDTFIAETVKLDEFIKNIEVVQVLNLQGRKLVFYEKMLYIV